MFTAIDVHSALNVELYTELKIMVKVMVNTSVKNSQARKRKITWYVITKLDQSRPNMAVPLC